MNKIILVRVVCWLMVTGSSCMAAEHKPSTFDEDVAFLKKHTDVVVLKNNGRQVAVVPQYQGRVMTSTTSAGSGASFGWLNYKVIEKGLLSDKEKVGKLEDHIYVFGGEERFWLGPEGGQFSIFFKPGDPFEFAKWKTPAAIDTHPYKVVGQTKDSIVFTHDCELLNHSGTTLSVGIKRTVRLVSEAEVSKMLKMPLPSGIEFVAYESDNVVINKGNKAWTKQTGMLSIWILGMYKPSPETVVVIPFVSGPVKDLGPRVNDAYFGKVPSDYIRVEKDKVFFKGDGTRRGKIGISPERSMGIAGSYDTAGKTLTLVTYNVPDKHQGYVNSMWELQKNPFDGDALNAYNDGSPGPGLKPLGPFYELETSSPAAALATNESMRHVQRTIHITGPEKQLNDIAKTMLHVSLKEIKEAFK